MTSLHEMLPKARALVMDLERRAADLEYRRGRLSDADIMLSELSTLLQLCESLVAQERREAQQRWRAQLAELGAQRDFLDQSLAKFKGAAGSAAAEARDREKLLRRRQNMPDFMVDAYAEEGASVSRSTAAAQGIVANATAQLGMLREQRETLKNAQRAALDVLNRLGVSQSLMRAVERRDAQDRILVFGGMALTGLILYFCIWYTGAPAADTAAAAGGAASNAAAAAARSAAQSGFDLARE